MQYFGGINKDNSDTSAYTNSKQDFDIKANDSSVEGENKVENIGVAVFKNDKLVGELSAIETTAFLSIRNKVDRFLISIPDPLDENNYLDIYITPKSSTDVKIDTSTSSPFIKINCEFTAQIYSMTDNSKYLDPNSLNVISDSCNSYLKSIFLDYLYKSSKDFKSDINGLGIFATKNFFTNTDFVDYDWEETYKNAFFGVNVETSVKSGMLINET